MMKATAGPSSNVDRGMMEEIIEQINSLKSQLESQKDFMNKKFDQVDNKLNHKADRQELADLEEKLMRMLEIIQK